MLQLDVEEHISKRIGRFTNKPSPGGILTQDLWVKGRVHYRCDTTIAIH